MTARPGLLAAVGDTFRYIATWRTTGAVAPSGRALARHMVRDVDPAATDPVLELGPGNGVVTRALIERGLPPERIVAIEFNPGFCTMLAERFPGVRVVEGDAFDLATALRGIRDGAFSHAVSSLPLLLWPAEERRRLVRDVLARLAPGGAMVQFSYSPKPPVDGLGPAIATERSGWILANLPPARVWTFRRV